MKVFLVAALSAGLLIPGVALAESLKPLSAAWCDDFKKTSTFIALLRDRAGERFVEAMEAGDEKRATKESKHMDERLDELAKRAAIYSAFCKK